MSLTNNEITQMNYEESIKEVVELIGISDFVAIDATVETTGFLLKNETFNPAYLSDVHDANGKWYDVIKSREKTSCLLEVGIAIFKRSPGKSFELEAEVFNIPILPACLDDNEIARFRGNTWVRVAIDGYGLEFINDVRFDINKSLYFGTPFINKDLRERGNQYMIANSGFMVANRKRRLSSYLMPKLYSEVTEVDRHTILERLKGVCKIFEAISNHKIPLIGHHLLLKLIFIYKDFFQFLPPSYSECISKIKSLFELIYDTKQLATDLQTCKEINMQRRNRLQNHNLYDLLRNANMEGEKYEVNIGERSIDYVDDVEDILEGHLLENETSSFCYVAGFDALVTGIVFLNLIEIIKSSKLNCTLKSKVSEDYLELFLQGRVTQFKNKIYREPHSLPFNECNEEKGETDQNQMQHKLSSLTL